MHAKVPRRVHRQHDSRTLRFQLCVNTSECIGIEPVQPRQVHLDIVVTHVGVQYPERAVDAGQTRHVHLAASEQSPDPRSVHRAGAAGRDQHEPAWIVPPFAADFLHRVQQVLLHEPVTPAAASSTPMPSGLAIRRSIASRASVSSSDTEPPAYPPD